MGLKSPELGIKEGPAPNAQGRLQKSTKKNYKSLLGGSGAHL